MPWNPYLRNPFFFATSWSMGYVRTCNGRLRWNAESKCAMFLTLGSSFRHARIISKAEKLCLTKYVQLVFQESRRCLLTAVPGLQSSPSGDMLNHLFLSNLRSPHHVLLYGRCRPNRPRWLSPRSPYLTYIAPTST